MNPMERVFSSIRNEKADRIPLDLGSSFVTGITKNAYIRFADHLGISSGKIKLYDTVQQLPYVEEEILRRLEVDIRGLIPNFVRKNPEIQKHREEMRFVDEWGLIWEKPQGALYYDIIKSPLSGDVTEKDIENYAWPSPSEPGLWEGLVEKGKQYHEEGYAVILESICSGIFEMGCRLRGYETFYMDMAMNPAVTAALLDKLVELKIQFYEEAAKRLGPYVHFIREGDDMAGQESFLISPQMYRDIIKPRHKQLFEAQRKLFPPPFYVFFHSDGCIFDIIPDFIEIGVDILNPLQLTAKDMDAEKVKREYGKDISFWGGGVDTQNILPRGTPKQVRQNVTERIKKLSPDGGYIFGTVHNIQDDVPLENIVALFETFMELRKY